MRIPDWIVLLLVLSVVLWALYSGDKNANAPEAPPEAVLKDAGPFLPGPGRYDDEVLVQLGDVTDGLGTAFSLDRRGLWMTARHVVDGCDQVGLIVGSGRMIEVHRIETPRGADLAILHTGRMPASLTVNTGEKLRVGEAGFHVGFPQGVPGEATSRLLSRSRLITRGRYRNEEPVLAWAEMGRTRGLEGTLAGISGGPVFNSAGEIIGVTVAESPRRGRIYTASPDSLQGMLEMTALQPEPGHGFPISIDNYGREADRLRAENAVVKVVCYAEKGA